MMIRFWQRLFRITPWTTSLLVVAALGCGESVKGPDVVPVTGTVTLEGTPLENVGVSFRPDESKGNKAGFIPAGTTDAGGKYELETVSKKGAPAGWYKVVVIPYTPPPSGGEVPKTAQQFNKKYSLPDQTDLSFEVTKSDKPLVFDIELTK